MADFYVRVARVDAVLMLVRVVYRVVRYVRGLVAHEDVGGRFARTLLP